MADVAEYAGAVLEAGAMLNAASEFLVNQPDTPLIDITTLAGGGPTACVVKLTASVALAQQFVVSDSIALKSLGNMLLKPVAEFVNAFDAVFIPNASAFENMELGQVVQEFANQVKDAMLNPFASMLQMQSSIMARSLDQFQKIFVNSDPNAAGLFNEYYDRGQAALNTLIFSDDGGTNLGGLVLYAIEEALPGIESELIYLKLMKKQVRGLQEEISKLPDSFQPQLPNLAVTDKLCDAETLLRQVEAKLRKDNVFDRSIFARATKAICDSKNIIFDGSLDADFFKRHATAFTGLNSAQLDQIKKGKFLPNAGLSLKLLTLRLLNEQMAREDDHIRRFNANLIGIIDTLKTLAKSRLGEIMSLFVAMLRLQISAVRADLESQGQGFNGYIDARYEAQVRQQADPRNTGRGGFTVAEQQAAVATVANSTAAGGKTGQTLPNGAPAFGSTGLGGTNVNAILGVRQGGSGSSFGKQSTDVYSYISSQATAYAILSGCCLIAEQINRIVTVINQLLSAESTVVKAILAFLDKYKGEQCGDGNSGIRVENSVKTLINAVQKRVGGGTNDNRFLEKAASDAIKAIEEHEKFLVCMRTNLFFGNAQLAAAVGQALAILNLASNVAAIIRRVRQISKEFQQYKELLKNLDIAKMLGLDFLQMNAIDAMFAALQCLMLQCPNSIVSELANSARREFQPDRNKLKSNAITMGSLDEIPKAGANQQIGERINAILRLIRAIQDLTNFDLGKLCSIQTAPLQSVKKQADGTYKVQAVDPFEIAQKAAAAQQAYAQQLDTARITAAAVGSGAGDFTESKLSRSQA